MKKLAALLTFAICFAAAAEELKMDGPMELFKKEWNDGTMTGKNTHSARIGGKVYPDIWHYWYVDSGLTPETIKLAPLNAISPDSKAAKVWKNYHPILAQSIKEKGSMSFPALLRNSLIMIHTKKTFGCAYGFKNPFDQEVVCYIEGRLLHDKKAMIYVYLKHKDGTVTQLVKDDNPDAVEDVVQTYPGGRTGIRHYLKLQIETRLKPGDLVVIAGVRPDLNGKYVGKNGGGTFHIDGWGKAYNPVISFEKKSNE